MALRIVTNALSVLINPGSDSGPGPAGATQRPEEALLASFASNLDALGRLLLEVGDGDLLRRLRDGVCATQSVLAPLLGSAADVGGAGEADVAGRFGRECLLLLLALKAAMAEARAAAGARGPLAPAGPVPAGEGAPPPPLPADALSVGQTRTVQAALQFGVTLAVCPMLLPGVGVPLERRSSHGALLRALTAGSTGGPGDCGGGPPLDGGGPRGAVGPSRLAAACAAMLALCDDATLGSLVLTRHLGDVLAALCQLCHAPAAQQVSAEETRHYERKLSRLLQRVYQPTAVRELLVLQGAGFEGGRSPRWLRVACGRMLGDALLRPRGVLAVVGAVMDGACGGPAGGDAATDWRGSDAVARVLASSAGRPAEQHYRSVCPQVLEILHVEGRQAGRLFHRVAATTAVAMAREHPGLAHRHLLSPMLAPLARCTGDGSAGEAEGAGDAGAALVEEAELSRCVDDIGKVFVGCSDPPEAMLVAVETVLHPLFLLYCFAKRGVSHVRSVSEEALLWFVERAERPRAVRAVGRLAGLPAPSLAPPPTMPASLHFAPGAGGGAEARRRPPIRDEEEALCGAVEEDAWRLACLADLLAAAQTSGFAGDFFLSCLKELSALMSGGDAAGTEGPGASEEGRPGEGSPAEEVACRRLQLMQLIPFLCERLGHGILQRTAQVLEFVGVTLERCAARRGLAGRGEEGRLEAESLRLAVGLAAATLAGAELSAADRAAQASLLGPLERIVNSDPDPELRNLASDLRIAIATHGAVLGGGLAGASRATRDRGAGGPRDDARSGEAQADRSRGRRPAVAAVTVEEMLEATSDPEVPVVAAALRTLTGLVQERRADAIEAQDKILEVLLESVDHEDPFVYLSAIQGLAVMADRHPARVFPRLLEEYAGGGGGGGANEEKKAGESVKPARPPHSRVKLGEALVRAIRALGDVAPAYRDRLAHAFLVGARDPDPMVRASSLSNVGELCALLPAALGSMVHELCACLDAVVRSDPCAEARRAAVHAVIVLLRGLGSGATEVLRDVLLDVYRLLKHAERSDGDAVTVAHARTALADLDGAVRASLLPGRRLEKKITVLP